MMRLPWKKASLNIWSLDAALGMAAASFFAYKGQKRYSEEPDR